MAPQSGGQSARDVLEEFGKKIQEIATTKAHTHRNKLKGNLAHAVFLNGKISEHAHSNPCKLNYEFDTNVTSGKSDPCHGRWPVRFSDESRSQCTDNRIKDSTSDTVGACAPYRRLHLCDQNLEQIVPDKIKSTHNLLVDVLLAAKHEGKSLVDNHKEYKDSHKEFDSNICTILARSFADIGDIIRGKDLFLGGRKQEKKKLEADLKKLFEKLYEELKKHDTMIKNTYEKDGPDFYQLREDWWNANRQEVWKAITCEAKTDDKYNVIGPDGKIIESNMGQCRNFADVPTNLDYVPQYLRWFDEWTEEFCRKRKKQLQNAIEKCRGENESGEPKYCSLNGCNCKTTVRGKKQFDYEQECTDCLVACDPFVHWIDNQELEFLKQKEKYKNEIKEKDKIKETKYGKINKIYAKEFYDKLKNSYGTVYSFLKLLNKEKQCENHPEVEEGKKTSIDFNDNNETFSHTKICEPCPWCGVKAGGPPWEDNDIESCGDENIISFNDKDTTDISILSPNKENQNILEKLKDFCSNSSNKNIEMEKWRCHYQDTNNDNCILQDGNTGKRDQRIMPYFSFFSRWLTRMLDDSIDWRTQLNNCINNGKSTKCKGVCKKPCECFERWVEQKQKEWISIEHHFDQQGNIQPEERYVFLKAFLEIFFMEKIKKAYGEEKSQELMDKLEKNGGPKFIKDTEHSQDAIKILLEHELEEAESCLKNHEKDDCPDEDSEDEEETDSVKDNPCAVGKKLIKPNKNVTKIAKQMHRQAKKRMRENTRGSGGISKLRADASKGEYKDGVYGSKLKGDNICKISTIHSNATGLSNNPCNGKDKGNERFKIGTKWEGDNFVSETHKNVYIPPRRQHICISNLEYLQTGEGPLKGKDGADKVNDSFLGDVILSAKVDAEKIIELYKEHNDLNGKQELEDPNDQESICRAMKYSFADIGDIIRGRDMWDNENRMPKLREYLQTVFDKIKEKIPEKYKSDKNHIKLREDWWEANRDQVWNAMKCAYSGKIQCSNHTPLDDYIPQRLRWMTEWSEWYCKEQKKQYDKLVAECRSCKGKNEQCTNVNPECSTCTQACKGYTSKIKSWADQWDKIKNKYTLLYLQAKNDAGNHLPSVYGGDPNDQHVVYFLKELHKQNGGKKDIDTVYSTAAGYIHQELQQVGCNTQTKFCLGGDTYAFVETPTQYEEACKCDHNTKKLAPEKKKEEEEPVCDIVKKLLDDKDGVHYTEACELKYKGGKERYTRWNCDPSKFKTGQQDGACMPPRRQKLYLKKLEKLDSGEKSSSKSDLRKAFIECAAVETFFSWHKYKMDKIREDKEKNVEIFGVGYKSPVGEDLQNDLESGTIPEGFKRKMFYTYGDYRDLCLGKDICKNMDEIENKINNVFQNIDSKSPSDRRRQDWWDKNAKSIWDGMLCALSYDTKERTFKDEVHIKLTENKNNRNNYNNVTINSIPNSNDGLDGDKTDTKLAQFASRPQFIRWLEEWGDEFCRKRTYKLKRIEEECRGKYNGKYCDGDGFDCTKMVPNKERSFEDFNCPSCAKSCTSYKQWIRRKKEEFYKQKEKYQKEIEDPKTYSDNIYDKQFVENLLKDYKYFDVFLEKLKEGPYSKDITADSTINFKKPEVTFGPAEKCAACPVFGVQRKGGVWSNVLVKTCEGNNFTTRDIKNRKHPIKFNMLVSDNSPKGFEGDLPVCTDTGIFEGIRENKWSCGYVCALDICDMESVNEKKDDQQNIQIRALFKRWIESFLKDYNKINNKISYCINNKEGSKCIKGCKNKCDCVEEWIKLKKVEWEKIRNRYKQQYKFDDTEMKSFVISFLERLQPQTEVEEIKGKFNDLRQLEESRECTDSDTSQMADNKNNDVLECLLNKLQKEIKSCKDKHNKLQSECDPPPKPPPQTDIDEENSPDTSTSPDDPNDTQNPVFCPNDHTAKEKEEEPEVQPEPTEESNGPTDPGELQEEEEGGEASQPQDDNKTEEQADENEASVPEQTSEEDRAPPPAAPPKEKPQSKKRPKPKITLKEYKLNDVLLPSAFPLSVGIAFAALSYFVLKKKTKSTIDLLRVINIPKGDYDIPTLKSSNRYIPYASDRYKGKTYIYMEGDSADEKYIGDISSSDITSSESEYEEFDINDIYPYKSPKYKTLIDVVLEPSKRDIQSDDTPTNKFTDNEWNVLKNDFITNILQSEQNDIPNNDINGNTPLNTHLNTLYFDNTEEKPFITKIHDRNLYSAEEISYNINMTNNDDIPISGKNDTYSGIDLINDSLNSDQYIDIYDEVLKRKENELFGTNHTKKNTSTNSAAKLTNSDPISNQLEMFHKWLDRHRNMCDQWDKNKKEELLDKLKKEWNKENNNNSAKTYNSDNKSNHNHVLNTDVSIQIDMDNPKTKNEITNMDTNPDKSTTDTILDDLEKYNEPYYYDFYEDDIIYHDVHVEKSSMDDIYVDHNNVTSNNMDVPTKMHIEMNIVNNKKEIFEEEYPISDIWNI